MFLQLKKGIETLNKMQKVSKDNTEISKKRLRQLNLYSLEKGILQGEMITSYKYLQGNNLNEGCELFTASEDDRTRCNDLNLRKGKFRH